MDYVTRQFIVLAKKLRDECHKFQDSLHRDLSHLSDGLKNLKDAISAEHQPNDKRDETPVVSVAELRTHVPIRVQTKADESKRERIWRVTKSTLEIVGILAVLFYTWVSYGSWQEQIDATNFASIQTKKARESLNETIKNFRQGQRPWIKFELGGKLIPNADPTETKRSFTTASGKPLAIPIRITNIGNTAAESVKGFSEIEVVAKGVDPDIPQKWGVPPSGGERARAVSTLEAGVIVPQDHSNALVIRAGIGNDGSPGAVPLSRTEALALESSKAYMAVYGEIRYRDVFAIDHWTKFCKTVPEAQNYKCQRYNAVDHNP